MKYAFLIIVLILSTLGLNAQGFKNVNAPEFKSLIEKNNGLLIDVRTPGEYSRAHIDGSTLISVADRSAPDKIKMLQKDKPIYVYCLTGSRSFAVANYLSRMGFKEVYNLQRGIVEWNQMGFPVKQGTTVAKSESKIFTPTDINSILNANKLVLLNFHAPWCAPCKKMAPEIEKAKSAYSGKLKVEKIDIDANKSISQTYKVQSIPGLVLYKNGTEVWRHTGVINYSELESVFKKYL